MILFMESISPPPSSSSWYPSPQAARSLDLGRSGAVVGGGEEAEVAHNQQRQKTTASSRPLSSGVVYVCHKGKMSSEIAYTSDQRLKPPKVPTSKPKPVQVLRGRGRLRKPCQAHPAKLCRAVPTLQNTQSCRADLICKPPGFFNLYFSFLFLCFDIFLQKSICVTLGV